MKRAYWKWFRLNVCWCSFHFRSLEWYKMKSWYFAIRISIKCHSDDVIRFSFCLSEMNNKKKGTKKKKTTSKSKTYKNTGNKIKIQKTWERNYSHSNASIFAHISNGICDVGCLQQHRKHVATWNWCFAFSFFLSFFRIVQLLFFLYL